MKPNYEIINHGPEHSDYFQGCGTAFTPYRYCVTGIGDNASNAYQDALDQAFDVDEDTARHLPKRPAGIRKRDKIPANANDEDSSYYWHVSIRFGTDE